MVTLARALRSAASVLLVSLAGPASAVTIDWVPVGAPGNVCDVQAQGCFGAVAYSYRISKYEVTNAQYTEFLNAVAVTDTNGLYSASMSGPYGGITRSGSPGSYSYSAITDRGSMPVNYVSFWDSLRFANWLHNGQPAGAQGNATTEDGAYTLTPAGIAQNLITRNTWASVFLTSEDEWYKAAYYDVLGSVYYDYPAGTDVQTVCAAPGATANTANCSAAVGDLTNVGSYTGSGSPNATFDQAGNVFERNEAIISGSSRGVRGGSFAYDPSLLAASTRANAGPPDEDSNVGFRVASPIPEPGTGWLLMTSILGLAGYRRRRA